MKGKAFSRSTLASTNTLGGPGNSDNLPHLPSSLSDSHASSSAKDPLAKDNTKETKEQRSQMKKDEAVLKKKTKEDGASAKKKDA